MHPEIVVKLIVEYGNVFNLIGICVKAMRQADLPKEEIDKFTAEVMNSGSYDEALQVILSWFTVE